jgi:hypothetical protein
MFLSTIFAFFGFNNDLRGYYAGQFRDRRMFATQLEYRLELLPRISVAGFVKVGGLAPTLSKFRGDELLRLEEEHSDSP